jgi:hypothetical protein
MRWTLIAILFAAIAAMFVWSSTSASDLEGFDAPPERAATPAPDATPAPSSAFDAYLKVHGSPPITETLQHYREVERRATLTFDQLVARIESDKQHMPPKIAVTDASVDAELLKLKHHAESAEALQAPVVPARKDDLLAAKLQSISDQLSDLAQRSRGPSDGAAPKGLESFINFR